MCQEVSPDEEEEEENEKPQMIWGEDGFGELLPEAEYKEPIYKRGRLEEEMDELDEPAKRDRVRPKLVDESFAQKDVQESVPNFLIDERESVKVPPDIVYVEEPTYTHDRDEPKLKIAQPRCV